MKHNLLKSLIISVILLTGVSNAWGYTISSAKVYYDDSNSQWSNNVVIAFDKGYKDNNSKAGGAVFAMTKIDNTSLYYWSGTWGDEVVSYMRFGKTEKKYDWYAWWTDVSSTWDLSTHDSWDGVSNGWGLDINNASVLFGATSAEKGADLTKTDLSGYSALNSQQTIKSAVNGADANSKATISITSYKMTDNGQATQQTATLGTGAKDSYVTAARTATTTLTVGTVAIGYKFDGWYMAATGGTALSTSTTYTYYPTAATTIYARFSAQPSTTIYLEPTGHWNSDNPQYVAHVWKNSVNEDIIMTGVGDSPYRYYKAEVPYGYTNVVFYRKSTDGTTIWNQTADLPLPTNDNVLYTITSTGTNKKGDNGYEAAGGNWKVANLVYTVTLEATSNGSFQVTCNGETKTEGEIFENVAAGTQLTITKIKPHNDGYDQTMVYSTDGYKEFDTYEVDNQGNRTYTYTVNSDVTIAEDFRTKEINRIYVKVPYGYATDYWRGLRILPMNGVSQYKAGTDELVNAHAISMREVEDLTQLDIDNKDKYILYYFDIPAGNHSFKLYPQNSTKCSRAFWYEIVEKEGEKENYQNCWLINNTENNTDANGEWVSATVTLGSCEFGTFSISHSGAQYTNLASKSLIISNIPYGDQITIEESQHNYPNTFNGDLDIEERGNRYNLKSPVGKQLTVLSDITIVENFVVRTEAVADKNFHLFLKINNNVIGQWEANDTEEDPTYDGPGDEVYTREGYNSNEYANFVWLGETTYLGQTIQGSTPEERGCPSLVDNEEEEKKQPNGHFLMHKLNIKDDDYTYYYCTITDSCWLSIKFERKHADSDPHHYPLRSTEVLRFAGDENVCYTIDGYSNSKFTGSWGPAPKCTVTLGYCEFGTYAIEYNGQKYFAQQPKQEVKIPVAFGEKIKILEGQPASNAYSGGTILDALDPDPEFRALEINEEIIVKKDFTVDDNFVTKGEHVVYLGVPTSLSDWKASEISNQQADEFAYYIWRQNRLGWIGMEDEFDKSCEYLYEDNGIRYYKFRIKAGCYAFQFQRKKNNRNSDNGTFAQSQTLYFQIPLDNVNCYTLRDEKSDDTHYLGSWGILPPRPGDYRLLYAEKELIKTHEEGESEDWETAFRTIYSHPSDVIRKRTDLNDAGEDIVSLHINTSQKRDSKTVHPMVILQQYQTVNSTNQWVDIEAHTVLPLKAHGNMAMLPGRKKAYGEFPFYSDGIDAIKDDLVDKGSGVWNFIVEQDIDENTKNMTTTLHLDKEKLKRYKGTYYIRTTNTLGGWINYYNEDNHMKFSSYSKQYRGFSHYYCKWVDITKHSEDVRFVVANDYGSAISEELIADTYSNSNGEITENANIRWSWNIVDNKVSRAYIQGTWDTKEPPTRLDNIVAIYKTSKSASDSRELLDDTGDWIYSKDIQNVQVGSQLVSLTAQYPSGGDTQIFAEDMDMLVGEIEQNQNKYVVRILYDFKIDKTMVTLVPDENNADIAIDVLIERIDQGEATQVRSNITNTYKTITNANGETETGATVYAMMTFNKAQLTDSLLSDQRRFTYWISFPFDVNIADVFGFSEYGKQWRIRTYNSQSRAENGYNGTQTYWEYIDINQTPVLEANKGYILVLNAKLRNPEHSAYTNRSSLSLYFPSANLINDLDTACIETSVVVPRNEGQAPSKDWNWNMIGVPSYANKDRTISQDHLYYFFEYNYDTDSYEVCWAGKKQRFKSMFAYMVQFAGTIDWTNFKVNSGQFPEQLAAKKDASAEINHVMRLELLRNNQREDKTYIQLTENENATEQFDMNFDLTKMANAKANLYSLIGNHQLAANVLPLQTTIVPLGVIIKTAGEYTFSMPDGTAGIIAELIDYQTNTRTNLLLDNYTVTLPAGTNNSRFALSLQPDKTVTSVDNIGNEATGDKVKKYLIDGVLYMQKDGALYDAQGRCVQ